EAHDLPFSLASEPLARSSPVSEALLRILALARGDRTRREILDVVTHPNVHARFPEADTGVWLDLCESLSVARGADRAALGDTYIDRDLFNWDQACRRLALGRFARGPRSGADAPILLPSGLLPSGGGAAAERYLP